ncbi:MAG: uracil-DNA glycosylase family protein [Muribaculaceae bacterium]|nr:uracil-DNA glycosylase family protein [Muribaculaceae bacterium]MDE6609764.1 uracil-DNA glycosylase family protein [Muribaculaceae bacterium]
MKQDESPDPIVYSHPWEPFVPAGARILMMGTFPPGDHRWAMDFYYPNPTNDFWKMMGIVFCNDAGVLYDSSSRTYRLDEIKRLLTERHIAMHDTAHKVIRLKGNASDKFLQIVEPTDLAALLSCGPEITAVCTTGEKAADVIAELTGSVRPRMGEMSEGVCAGRRLHIWRMPSTSRAYPLKVEKKAEYYRRMFEVEGVI